MVFRDLSFNSNSRQLHFGKNTGQSSLRIASVHDRMLATFFDLLVMSPVVTFFVASIFKQIHLTELLQIEDDFRYSLWTVGLVAVIFMSSFIMALFLYFWGATPGQKFMQLQVVTYPSINYNRTLSFDRCLFRSFLWCLSWFTLGLPFFEILSHPLRRSFHERASDTLVVTLKQQADSGPVPIEMSFVRSLLRFICTTAFFFSIIYFEHIYSEIKDEVSVAKSASALDEDCLKYQNRKSTEKNKLDLFIALRMADQISYQCLESVIGHVFWSKNSEKDLQLSALAYLGKAINSEDAKLKEEYVNRVCQEAGLCDLAKLATSKKYQKPTEEGFASNDKNALVTGEILSLRAQIESGYYRTALKTIKSLERVPELKSFLERKYVGVVWKLKQEKTSELGATKEAEARKPSSEMPSNSELKQIYSDFESKYDLRDGK